VLRRFGLALVAAEAVRAARPERRSLLESRGLGILVDAGANTGQYARALRLEGFRGEIVSLEPVAEAFHELERRAARDPAWSCRRVALGSHDGSAEIRVAKNSVSSSLLDVTARHLAGAPGARVVRTETVPVARLDTLAPELLPPAGRVYLKLDVQGGELEALRGAEGTLDRVDAVEAELSLAPLYAGQPLFGEVVAWLDTRGFDLVSLDPGFTDPASGKLLQLDGLFARRRAGG
jgi:FkbM family methyltransferase